MKNKREGSESPLRFCFRKKTKKGIILPAVIFLVLTAAFIAMLFFFVYKSSTGAFLYEQIYAKEIAMAIDKARPGMEVHIDVKKGVDASRENRMHPKFQINDKEGIVLVSLGGKAGYRQYFFSDYSVSNSFSDDGNILILNIGSKNG